jgi:pimeloyl-ACP methyl ester carboxylesterase
MSAPLTKALGLNRPAGKDEIPEKKKSTASTLVAIGGAVAVLSGVIAFAKEINNGDIVPEIKDIAAGELHGTMINARNSDPVVLIVPGSGPTDRNGNNPMGMKTDAYKLLAEGLSEERVSTVRIDKRGMFGSAGAGDPNISSPQAYVDDIHAWIDAIKLARGSKCVFLLGHSEGALMVSLAAEGRKDVCGLILVSGMGRKMGDVIREQLTSNPANAPVLDQALGALSGLEAGRHVDVTAMHPALLPLFNPKVQDYLISMFAIDPVEAVRKANKDTLIVQGERDLQVTVADARLLDKAPHTRLRLIKQMNHVLKDAPEDRAGNLATYADPSLPLSRDLVKYVRRFVKDND